MKKVFLDANIIDLCDVTLIDFFRQNNLIPVVGCNTTYENMCSFFSKSPGKGPILAQNILNLNPLVVIPHDKFYFGEINKLINNTNFSPFIALKEFPKLYDRLLNFSKGVID